MGVPEMNDPATPNGQPPYWAKCEKMTFVELRRFIGRTLNRLSGHSAFSDEELPRSEEELEAPCNISIYKADTLKEEPNPIPEPPTYDGPELPELTAQKRFSRKPTSENLNTHEKPL